MCVIDTLFFDNTKEWAIRYRLGIGDMNNQTSSVCDLVSRSLMAVRLSPEKSLDHAIFVD